MVRRLFLNALEHSAGRLPSASRKVNLLRLVTTPDSPSDSSRPRMLSRSTVARRALGFPRLIRGAALASCSSCVSYQTEAPIHSIMLNMVDFLLRDSPASRRQI